MKLRHQLWFLEEDGALDQILEIGIDASTDACILSCPLTGGHVNVIADLVPQKQRN